MHQLNQVVTTLFSVVKVRLQALVIEMNITLEGFGLQREAGVKKREVSMQFFARMSQKLRHSFIKEAHQQGKRDGRSQAVVDGAGDGRNSA